MSWGVGLGVALRWWPRVASQFGSVGVTFRSGGACRSLVACNEPFGGLSANVFWHGDALGPVFNGETVYAAEFALVVGDQHPALGAGVGSDPEVVVAYGLTVAL